MEKNCISCIYHASSVVLVDDNWNFIHSLSKELHTLNRRIQCQLYVDPVEALQQVCEATGQHNFLLENTIIDTASNDYLPASGHLPVQYDITQLYKHLYKPEQFSEVSVVVVDFAMPIMNGAEFCRQLSDSPVKKILLTGEADSHLAVKLFNEGIIDKFILKSDANLEKELIHSILQMQKSYFNDLTAPLVKGLAMDKESALGDPEFIALFDKICRDTAASSYYLIEPAGSYLLIDDNGSPTWFIVKTPEELHDFAELMEDAGNVSPEIIESVRSGQQVPYFKNFHNYLSSVDNSINISKCLHKAETLNGNKKYSYFVTKELSNFDLDKNKVASFDGYLKRAA